MVQINTPHQTHRFPMTLSRKVKKTGEFSSYKNKNLLLFQCVFFIHAPCFFECILFYVSFIWPHVYVFAIHSMVHCRSAFEPGASGLPYYCTSICVHSWCNWRASLWIPNQKKYKNYRLNLIPLGTKLLEIPAQFPIGPGTLLQCQVPVRRDQTIGPRTDSKPQKKRHREKWR